jgi:hypothetical protein
MTRAELAGVMDRVFEECRALRNAGQQEYARREENALANFERVAERCDITREKALMVYAEKHLDGIHSWINGHRSQRESVKGRINDAIVYLCILRGMVEELENQPAIPGLIISGNITATPTGPSFFMADIPDGCGGSDY